MEKIKDRRIAKTKNAVQAAYFDILSEHKDRKITVAEIARRANIDRKTFYLHYESVEDIIKEFCKDKIIEYIEKKDLKSKLQQGFSILMLFEVMNGLIAENLEIMELISIQNENNYFFNLIKKMLIDALCGNFSSYFPFGDTELRVYSEFYISGIISVYRTWINNNVPLTVDKLAEMVTKVSLKGLESLYNDK